MRWAHALPGVALALIAAALFASEGSSTDRLFWIGAAVVVAVGVAGELIGLGRFPAPALSRPAAVFLALLAALVLWQALSIEWSLTPERSWDYANRGLVYFAFACLGALLVGVPARWILETFASLLGALFVVALAAKVFPSLYDDYGRLARLRWPVGYWNQLALLGAMAVPPGLWLARRARLAAALLLYGAFVTVVLTYSRTGVLLASAAAVAWLVLERDRLAAVEALAVATPVAGAVAAIGLALPGVRSDGEDGSVRAHDGRLFGVALAVGAVAVAVAAHWLLGRLERRRAHAVVRAAAVVIAAVVLAGVIAVVARTGGPGEFVSARWHEFTQTQSSPAATRFSSTSSGNRWMWWQQAWGAFTDHPLQGTGAGSFRLTSVVESHNSQLATTEPHNLPLQFLSETGLVAFALYLGAVTAVLLAARRGELALGLVVLVAVVHAVVDIDWDYVATQAPLFFLAGYLVARPGRVQARRVLPVAAVAVAALAALYSLFSPWLSDRRLDAAYDAVVAGNFADAHADASQAHQLNPLATQPLYLLAATESDERARERYRRATELEPRNPETWYELGAFELAAGRVDAAYAALNRSYTLDRYGPAGRKGGLLDQARCKKDPSTCR